MNFYPNPAYQNHTKTQGGPDAESLNKLDQEFKVSDTACKGMPSANIWYGWIPKKKQ